MKWWNFIEEYIIILALTETLEENLEERILWNSLEIRDLCEPLSYWRETLLCQKVTAHYERESKYRDRAEEEEDSEEEDEEAAENPGRVRLINWDQVSLTNHTKRHRNQ